MIDRTRLLSDLQRLLRTLEADLLERSTSKEVLEVGQTLQTEYQKATKAERTAQSYEEWRSDYITQIAAAWVLSCVFARFLEDNRLVDPPKLAGPDERLVRARDEHELYFRSYPTETDREYLLHVFDELARLPGAKEIFGQHNPIHELPQWLSGDAAGELLKFFQKIEANTGALVHDFTDPNWDTRFLGDLYQDLSPEARKRYALLQTPEFVEEFILDRTLDPAIEEFRLEGFRMIDPACGSGHFLLGSFRRLLERWQKKEPGTNVRVLVQRALDSVYGVDVNPYAVAIARFRLLLAALRECGIHRLQDAPDFHFNLAVGDSLLHGIPGREQQVMHFHELAHHYQSEELSALQRILVPGIYHAVVANPPYITPKDKALNEAYRDRYSTCHMKYSLAVPFMERIFQLAVTGGYTGQITANSFMKREFGKKLIEEFLPRIHLTHVINTSGAYIPGHATPTVILLGRSQKPITNAIRTVMSIRGEPSTPDNPAQGQVWSAIINQIDQPGSQSEFVSVADSPRELFHKHPWSIGGGGAAELKEQLDSTAKHTLRDLVESIGPGAILGEDDAFGAPVGSNLLRRLPSSLRRPLIEGDKIRDWDFTWETEVLFPYDDMILLRSDQNIKDWLWPLRTLMGARLDFSKQTYAECGRPFWEYHQIPVDRNRTPLSIAFAFVATHNHFVLDRGGKVFNRSAPIIKLPSDATEDDHLALLGLLNSSTTCFWMKQISQPKQMTAGDGVRIETLSKVPHEFTGSQLMNLPIPGGWYNDRLRNRLIQLTREADRLGTERGSLTATSAIETVLARPGSIRALWQQVQKRREHIFHQLILLQEEIDFTVYTMFSLSGLDLFLEDFNLDAITIEPGMRPFCMIAGKNYEGFNVPAQVPDAWPSTLKGLWQRRIAAIGASQYLQIIEDAHYKRRWIGRHGKFNLAKGTDELEAACENWFLERLETYFDFDGRMNDEGKPTAKLDIGLVSAARLADVARQDAEFMQVGELYRGDPAFDVQKLVTELVEAESVPLLPVLRYKDIGLRKRAEWERTWDLQRQEDAIDARTKLPKNDSSYLSELEAKDLKRHRVGDIPVPPKYASSDFQNSTYWRLRGKLDVPKERWISFPYCAGDGGTLMIAWAGYDHLQLAKAISAYYVDVQERLGGRDDPRLVPLLACLIELLPWLKQWHNDVDPEFGLPMGDYFEGFIQEEARQMGKTVDDIKAWQPPQRASRRRGKAVTV
jgi:hypothetical protein